MKLAQLGYGLYPLRSIARRDPHAGPTSRLARARPRKGIDCEHALCSTKLALVLFVRRGNARVQLIPIHLDKLVTRPFVAAWRQLNEHADFLRHRSIWTKEEIRSFAPDDARAEIFRGRDNSRPLSGELTRPAADGFATLYAIWSKASRTETQRLASYEPGAHIEDRWNKGQFGKEWEDCDDMTLREAWNRNTGLGQQKIFEVRKIYNDVTFVDEFFTENFCRKHMYYTFGFNNRKEQWEIESRGTSSPRWATTKPCSASTAKSTTKKPWPDLSGPGRSPVSPVRYPSHGPKSGR